MTQNIVFLSLKFIVVDLIGEAVYFPLWWYSRGLLNAGRWCLEKVKAGNRRLGITIWLANLFVPMYGQRDYAGRIISFFIRIVQIIFRLILFFIWLIIILALFLFWLILPIFVIYQIFAQLFLY